MVLEWDEVEESKGKDNPKYFLVFRSNDKETLKSLSKHVLTICTKCESCGGDVIPSENEYLCLGGCGHVKGTTS